MRHDDQWTPLWCSNTMFLLTFPAQINLHCVWYHNKVFKFCRLLGSCRVVLLSFSEDNGHIKVALWNDTVDILYDWSVCVRDAWTFVVVCLRFIYVTTSFSWRKFYVRCCSVIFEYTRVRWMFLGWSPALSIAKLLDIIIFQDSHKWYAFVLDV